MVQLPIYLDHNATTPCDPKVVEAMLPYFNIHFGNAASRHHIFGWQAQAAVDLAREQVAGLTGAEPGEIIFTSGATEAVNLALKGVFEMYASRGNHIITCTTEHKAVLDTCIHLEKTGADITRLSVDSLGQIDLGELEKAIRKETILVALMYANNETGTVMPVREISAITRKHKLPFFSDATQAVGKISVDVQKDGIDLMAMSAHKFYGPKGAGALYVRRRDPRIRLASQMDGGGHEKGMRSGTLNVPGIVGLGMACALSAGQMEQEGRRLEMLRNRIEKELMQLGNVQINGDPHSRLPHVSNLSFRYVDSQALLSGLNKDIAVSTGSACTSGSIEPSHVLRGMGMDEDLAFSSLRISLGRNTTEAEILYAVNRISRLVTELRQMNPLLSGTADQPCPPHRPSAT